MLYILYLSWRALLKVSSGCAGPPSLKLMTGALSQNVSKLFSEVTNNLFFIYAETNWEATESLELLNWGTETASYYQTTMWPGGGGVGQAHVHSAIWWCNAQWNSLILCATALSECFLCSFQEWFASQSYVIFHVILRARLTPLPHPSHAPSRDHQHLEHLLFG